MYTITNKELRHVRGILRNVSRTYPYDTGECMRRKKQGCPQCRSIEAMREFLATLAPNA
jgi:hypothetical protein